MYQKLRKELANLIDATENKDELNVLLEGLLTPSEIEEIMFRWRLVLRLIQGQPQRDISADLGVSLGKIALVYSYLLSVV